MVDGSCDFDDKRAENAQRFNMQPKAARLPHLLQRELRFRGQRIQSTDLELIFVPTKNNSLWGFQVSKKISPLATKRNRMKRLLAEAVDCYAPQTKVVVNGILRARRDFSDKKLADVEYLVKHLFEKAGLL